MLIQTGRQTPLCAFHEYGNHRLCSLVRQIAARDSRALTELHAVAMRKLFSIANRTLRCKSDSEEIVSDVLLYVWENASSYDPARGSVFAWLSIMTKHRAIDCLRKRLRHIQLRVVDDSRSHSGESESTFIANTDDQQILQAALSELSSHRRTIIQLSFYEGWTHTQISLTLGMPLGTIKSDLRRAIKSMRSAVLRQ